MPRGWVFERLGGELLGPRHSQSLQSARMGRHAAMARDNRKSVSAMNDLRNPDPGEIGLSYSEVLHGQHHGIIDVPYLPIKRIDAIRAQVFPITPRGRIPSRALKSPVTVYRVTHR